MKMVPLKITKAEAKAKLRKNMATPVASDEPAYPWGTELSLDTRALEKLGIDPSDYEAGDVMEIRARAIVTTVSKRQTANGSDNMLALQITHLAIGTQEDDEEE